MIAMLEFARGGQPAFRVRLSRSETRVGRGERCDVTLPEEHVSRVHFVVRRRGERFTVLNRSRNGTLLNGAPVEEAELREDDELGVAPWTIRFRTTAAEAAAPTVVRDLVCPAPVVSVGPAGTTLTVEAGELYVREGPARGERYVIRKPEVRVGSDPGCDWVLTGDLEPHHFSVLLRRGRYRLRPEAASGPVRVDGVEVTGEVELSVGGTVEAGETAVELRTRTHEDPVRPLAEDRFGEMIGRSRAMRELFHNIRRVAMHDVPVLVLGESGTGKELVARALHDHGPRADGPFVAVNCGAIASELVESELFGHVRGAFTGATGDRAGAFREAHGGTLFLDEIGDLAPQAQVRFLRVLETGAVRPVGADRERPVDVRIVAATHRNLVADVESGAFREDLFFRLAVAALVLPPLRRRAEDIPLLARHFASTLFPDRDLTLSDGALERLAGHGWRGNVRALRNAILRAALAADGDVIEARHVQLEVLPGAGTDPLMALPHDDVVMTLERAERDAIVRALDHAGGNRTHAARALGIAKSTLLVKLKRYGIG